MAPQTATRRFRPGVRIHRRRPLRRHIEEATGNNSNRVASAYHNSKSTSGQQAALCRSLRRRVARSFLLRVSQVPSGEFGAPPHEAVTTQQFADPIGAHTHVRALLQVRCQSRSGPPGEDEAQVSRILLNGLHQQLEVGRRDARWPTRVGSWGQALEPELTPTTSAVVDCPRRNAQCLSDAAGALSLGTPEDNNCAQRLSRKPPSHCILEFTSLRGSQFDDVRMLPHRPRCHPSVGVVSCTPLNGFSCSGLPRSGAVLYK
jgi:hypothetical protein